MDTFTALSRPRIRTLIAVIGLAGLLALAFAVGSGRDGRLSSDAESGTGTGLLLDGDSSTQVPAAPGSVEIQSGGRLSDDGGGGAPAPKAAVTGSDAAAQGFSAAVVRTASVEVRIDEDGFTRAWAAANAVATRFGGYVADSSAATSGGDEQRLARGTLTLRIPADKLDAAVADLAGLGTLVSQSSSANDVSGQLFDYDARLRSLETQELQTLEIMRQAKTVTEILEVRSRLDSVRAEIERLKGRRQFLQQQVDLATLTATIFERGAAPAVQSAPGRFAAAWATALDVALTIVSGVIILSGVVVPLAAFALLAWLASRVIRRRPDGPDEVATGTTVA